MQLVHLLLEAYQNIDKVQGHHFYLCIGTANEILNSMSEFLIDLDELVLRCKDDEARKYIAEAVACYRAGAFRACIVTTWIAVVYDFVHKLRQLELTGDKNAIIKLQEFEKARNEETPEHALKFERNILEWARNEFEFLSAMQYDDLVRLQMDRNRCAHPSMISADEVYQPPAELARYHLRNAITHLLQHPPVQGQAALDRLKNDTLSEYFPIETNKAVEYFRHGPLANPKPALVRNLVVAILKTLLIDEYDEAAWQRFVAALNAVREMHRTVTEQAFKDQISATIQRISDQNLDRAIRFLKDVPDTWQFLTGDVCTKLENYVETLGKGVSWILPIALDIPELRTNALLRLESVSPIQLAILIGDHPRPEYVDKAVEFYAASASHTYQEANDRGNSLIIPLIPFFQEKHLEQIVNSAIPQSSATWSNQIFYGGAFQRSVLPEIKSIHNLTDEQFRALLKPLREAYPRSDFWQEIFPEDYTDTEET